MKKDGTNHQKLAYTLDSENLSVIYTYSVTGNKIIYLYGEPGNDSFYTGMMNLDGTGSTKITIQ